MLRLLQPRSFKPVAIKAYNPTLPTVFMHVPKTGGIALTNCLIEGLAPRTPLSEAFDGVLFGGFNSFESVDRRMRLHIYLDPAALPQGADFVSGHISLSTLTRNYAGVNAITVLREPRSRVLSLMLYWRRLSDDQLKPWGDWANYVSLARQSLIDFLSHTEIACQVDNVCTRLLLWPHRLIPNSGFIDGSADEVLIGEAFARLRQFTYVDVIENPGFVTSLEGWLGRTLNFRRMNETGSIAGSPQTLRDELTLEALDLLDARTRLDRQLWLAVARSRLPGLSAEALNERTFVRNVAGFALLVDTTPTPVP